MKVFFKKVLNRREVALLLTVVVICIIVGSISKNFFTMSNFRGVMAVVSFHAIVACAMTVVMISGGFDMSIGTAMALYSVILGLLLNAGVNFIISIIIVGIIGYFIGTCLGFIISKLNMNPFVTTLGAMFVFKGLASGFAFLGHPLEGQRLSLGNFPQAFTNIAGGMFHGVEYIVFYLVGILIIFFIFLNNNKFLKQNFYIGGNESAARLVGIKVDRTKIFNYALLGLMIAIAATLKASRYQFTIAIGSDTFALEVMGAVIIGGASLRGGEGSIIGTFLGVVLLELVDNSITILGINPAWYGFFVGFILLVSVLSYDLTKKFRTR